MFHVKTLYFDDKRKDVPECQLVCSSLSLPKTETWFLPLERQSSYPSIKYKTFIFLVGVGGLEVVCPKMAHPTRVALTIMKHGFGLPFPAYLATDPDYIL